MTDRAFKTSLPPACSCFFRGIEFEPSERVREEPPNDRNQKPKNQSSTENAGTVLVFWFFGFLVFGFLVFWFFGFLVFWFFGVLVLWFFGFFWLFWFFCGEGYIEKKPKTKKTKNQKTKEPKNQKTKEPKKQKHKKPKNQRTKKPKKQKTKKTKNQNCSSILRGALVFGFLVSVVGWFFADTFGGLKVETPEKADLYLY